jgi:hypothetical protein
MIDGPRWNIPRPIVEKLEQDEAKYLDFLSTVMMGFIALRNNFHLVTELAMLAFPDRSPELILEVCFVPHLFPLPLSFLPFSLPSFFLSD